MRAIMGLVLALMLAGCGATTVVSDGESAPRRTESRAPADPAPPADTDAAVAARACVDAEYELCVQSVLMAIEVAPGSLVAVCDYEDGQGDVVIIGAESEVVEDACSRHGLISPSRVVTVVELP